jgi:hypothetical protein
MAKSDEGNRRLQEPTGVQGAEPPAAETSNPARFRERTLRTLTRPELETLRARLHKKFH